MIEAFQAKRRFAGSTEQEFMQFLAKVMNTSVEQLQNTYAATSSTDYEELAKELTGLMEMEEENAWTVMEAAEKGTCVKK